MDCGVGLDENSITLGPLVRSASAMGKYIEGGKEMTREITIAVCSVKTDTPPIEVYTIVNGLNKKEPLLGRFILHDAVVRTYVGLLANKPMVNLLPYFRLFTIKGL
jgi:hypothetical protein